MKNLWLVVLLCGIGCSLYVGMSFYQDVALKNKKKIDGLVMKVENDAFYLETANQSIYKIKKNNKSISLGQTVEIIYEGEFLPTNLEQDIVITKVTTQEKRTLETLYNQEFAKAQELLNKMSLDEKIAQLLLVRYPESGGDTLLKEKNFGGYIFFARDFKNKTKENVINEIANLQSVAKVPILTAVDEEGGTVVRVSSNPLLRSEPFLSSQELYKQGGFALIKEDVNEKSALLKELGLNLNLAPVVDVSTNESDYMYKRSLGADSSLTSTYAKTVIEASQGLGVTYALKHFPGYGNNADTHIGSSVDTRTLESLKNVDLPPFAAGIQAGADAVLVSHNVVNAVDGQNPASLSASIHNLLRNTLNFKGIVITDDLVMGAITEVPNASLKAFLAGNNLLITTDYEKSMQEIREAITSGQVAREYLDQKVLVLLAFKYKMGLIK